MLCAGGLALGLAALAGVALKNRGASVDVVSSALPAAMAAIPAIANGNNHADCHSKTCVSGEINEVLNNAFETRLAQATGLATLADRQAQQFAGISTQIWEDRLTNCKAQTTLEGQVAALSQQLACCCQNFNTRLDYESRIAEMQNAANTQSILCNLPAVAKIQMYPPLCSNGCGCNS